MGENWKMISALETLKDAFKEVNEVWSSNLDRGDIDETEAIGMYPFEKSFDELTLEVEEWVDETIGELSGE